MRLICICCLICIVTPLFSQENSIGGSESGASSEKMAIPNYESRLRLGKSSGDSLLLPSVNGSSQYNQGVALEAPNLVPDPKNPDVPVNWHRNKNISILSSNDNLKYFIEISDTISNIVFGTNYILSKDCELTLSFENNATMNISISVLDSLNTRFIEKRGLVLPAGTKQGFTISLDFIDKESMVLVNFQKTSLGVFKLFSINLK